VSAAVIAAIVACSGLAVAALVVLIVHLHHRDSQPLSRLTDLTNDLPDPHWRGRSRKGHRR